MALRLSEKDLAFLRSKVRPPLVIILASPREAGDLSANLQCPETTCYQMDLYQADRLREELSLLSSPGEVVTAADLWDLPQGFQTAIFPAAKGGERGLKLDMVDQAYQVLRPGGTLIVLSPYKKDQFFPDLLKKIFGRYHGPSADVGQLLWTTRGEDRPRRRHEIIFQARFDEATSLRFRSRPGVFSYGRFDEGARALVEVMTIQPGDRVADVGCGCGTNGVWAGKVAGPEGEVAFIDSNLRALSLAEVNARENGLARFSTAASPRVEGVPEDHFDVIIANPPYYAQLSIARLFIERGLALLKPGGMLYLVTKQPNQLDESFSEHFRKIQRLQRRGYVVFVCQKD